MKKLIKTTRFFSVEQNELGVIYILSTRRSRKLSTAIQKSLEKWKLLCEFPMADIEDMTTCGFCNLYNSTLWDHNTNCTKCPIYSITSKRYCANTPYRLFIDEVDDKKKILLAKSELNFLKAIALYLRSKK